MEPLESFLLDTKAGYCQHFSAAMALLLRMGGVPARVATGFSPGGYSKRKQAWIVRDTDAHSWVEAWFDGYGWVTLDPTPSDTRRARRSPRWPRRSRATRPPDNPAGDPNAGGDTPADRRAAGSREELFNQLRGGGGTATEDDGAGGVRAAAVAADPARAAALRGRRAVVARRRRGRARTTRSTARSSSSRPRCAARPPGPGGHDAAPARAPARPLGRRGGYLRAVSARPLRAAAVRADAPSSGALRRELASGQGFAGRVRTFWALPPGG